MLGGGGGGDLALLSVPVVSVPCQQQPGNLIRSGAVSPVTIPHQPHQPTTVTTKYFLLGPEMRLQQGSGAAVHWPGAGGM